MDKVGILSIKDLITTLSLMDYIASFNLTILRITALILMDLCDPQHKNQGPMI